LAQIGQARHVGAFHHADPGRDCLAFQSVIGTGIVRPTSSTSLTVIKLDQSLSDLRQGTALSILSASRITRDWSVLLDNGIGRGRRLTLLGFTPSNKVCGAFCRARASFDNLRGHTFFRNGMQPRLVRALLSGSHIVPRQIAYPQLLRRNRISSLVSVVLTLLRHGTTPLVGQRAAVASRS
jgi:hypothetical protein